MLTVGKQYVQHFLIYSRLHFRLHPVRGKGRSHLNEFFGVEH